MLAMCYQVYSGYLDGILIIIITGILLHVDIGSFNKFGKKYGWLKLWVDL